jgi:hypothetical protein
MLHKSQDGPWCLTASIKEKIRIGPGQVLKLSLTLGSNMFYLLHSSAIVLLVLLSYKLGYKQAMNKEKINL